jgi:hypothetical protein
MGFNRRKEDQRREAAEKEAASVDRVSAKIRLGRRETRFYEACREPSSGRRMTVSLQPVH